MSTFKARGLDARLLQTEWADGSATVPRTMGGHFNYPRRSNVELGHRWDAFADAAPPAAHVPPAKPRAPPMATPAALAAMSDAELAAQMDALHAEQDRRTSSFVAS